MAVPRTLPVATLVKIPLAKILLVTIPLVTGLLVTLLLGTAAWGSGISERKRPVVIGLVNYLWGPTADMLALQQGLLQLGYRENYDFILGSRTAESDAGALEPIVKQLLRDGAQVIYASGWRVLEATLRAAPNTPVVFAAWTDEPRADGPRADGPGANRLRSLKSSKANATGVVNAFENLSADGLKEFLKLVPGIKRVMVPYAATDATFLRDLPSLRRTAAQMHVSLTERRLRTRLEAKKAIAAFGKEEAGGILATSGALNISGYALEATLRRRVPAMLPRAWMVEAGGLASYGPSWHGLGRQAAALMHKIIKGAHPRNIPMAANHSRELVINLRAAKALGIKIPKDSLARAHRVIGP